MSVDTIERSVGGYDGSGDSGDWEAWSAQVDSGPMSTPLETEQYGRGYEVRTVGRYGVAGAFDPNALGRVMPVKPSFNFRRNIGYAAIIGEDS